MTEERLKEIKDSIDFQREYYNAIQKEDFLFDEELELYNEVVRLKKILNCKEELCKYLPKDTEFVVLTKEDYERLTLEQLTGVENA
jgi:hypothetical protein